MERSVRRSALVLLLCGALAMTLFVTGPARAKEQAKDSAWTVSGPLTNGPTSRPDSGPLARLRLDRASGALTLQVSRAGRTVVEPSPVGIVTERADFSRGLRFLGRDDRTVAERYRSTVGKERSRTVRMTEARFRFRGSGGARLDVLVRVSGDGVAYRYVLPSGSGDVLGETSAFTLPADADAWLGTYRKDNENLFKQYTAATAPAGEYMAQALFETGGTYALIAESDLTGRYSAARLVHEEGSPTYRIGLWDQRVESDGPLSTPWRAMVVGDLATVTESTFTDDLAPASKVADTSRADVRPGRACRCRRGTWTTRHAAAGHMW